MEELQVLADSLNAETISEDGVLLLLSHVTQRPGLRDSLDISPSYDLAPSTVTC